MSTNASTSHGTHVEVVFLVLWLNESNLLN